MKVTIKDYQAIKNAELLFEPGVTVIIGSSNNGKSSLIRAIEATINNKGGSSFINYDADFCEVTIEDNNQKVIWHKDRNSSNSFYNINGTTLNKIGQKQIEDVGKTLNMPEVEINNDRFRLNFWKQLDFPFLVGKSHYQLFDFISKSKDQEIITDLNDITNGQIKDTNAEITDLNSKINGKTSDITDLEKEIKDLEKFDTIDVNILAALIEKTKKLDVLLNTFEEKDILFSRVNKQIIDINTKHGQFESLHSDFQITLKQYNDYWSYVQVEENINKAEVNVKSINEKIESYELKVKASKDIFEEITATSVLAEKLKQAMHDELFISDNISSKQNDIVSLAEKIKIAELQLADFDVCPFCGNILEEGVTHND